MYALLLLLSNRLPDGTALASNFGKGAPVFIASETTRACCTLFKNCSCFSRQLAFETVGFQVWSNVGDYSFAYILHSIF